MKKFIALRRSIVFPLLIVMLVSALAACSTPEATAVPTETVTLPTSTPEATIAYELTPSPETEPTAVPSPVPTTTPAPTSTATPVATHTPPSTATPVPDTETSFEIEVEYEWTVAFPDSITFSLEADSEIPIQHVELNYSYPLAHSCTLGHYSSVRLKPDDPYAVEVSWDWEMLKTGSIPPGTLIGYFWTVVDDTGRELHTETNELLWDDRRFDWSEHTSGNTTFFWYDGPDSFGQSLATAVENRLDRMELGVDLEKPIKAYIYPDSATLREAILYTQAWTGGLAFTLQNILLIAVGPTAPETEVDGLVHELAHLLVREVTFSCIGDMPTWLDEGLAEYAEGPVSADLQTTLDEHLANDSLITLQSLSSSFPADHSGALLAYGQSKSIVTYLIEVHGWDKMNELLDVFEQGSTYTGALTSVYGFDLQGLDSLWRTWLAAQ